MASDALTLRGFRRWRADRGWAAVVGFGGLFPLFSLRYPSKTQQKKLRLFPSSFACSLVRITSSWGDGGRMRCRALLGRTAGGGPPHISHRGVNQSLSLPHFRRTG